MRRMLTAVALLIAAGSAAQAACKDEVATALERQRKSSGFRMTTTMLAPEGKVNMTVEYLPPNRMRQVISSSADPIPVETVVANNYAWSRRPGEPWTPLNAQLTNELVHQMEETLGDDPGSLGEFECLGKQALEGKDMLAYQGENLEPGPKNLSKEKPPKLPDRPVRVIYVDTTTGLPMRSVYARLNHPEKPIFEATYSYPADIKIDDPRPAPAPSATPAPAGK